MQKLINSRGPIEDPSAVACARRSLTLVQSEGLLSYKKTNSLIGTSICRYSSADIDLHLLTLLKVNCTFCFIFYFNDVWMPFIFWKTNGFSDILKFSILVLKTNYCSSYSIYFELFSSKP